ncbi:MAG: lpxL 2 [Firmicutes bacterium]|nr:lpxL 2 [Bacillota bacterium]
MFHNLQYYFLKAISKTICLLPYFVVVHIGRGLGYLYYLAAKRQRERGIDQAMRGLEASPAEAEKVVRGLFYNLGQTLLEVMYMPALNSKKMKKLISIEGLDNLDKAMKLGKGVVFLTAHIGNWEWLAAALSSTGFPITTIVKAQPNDQYNRFLNEYREMMGVEVFSRGTSEMLGAARALKKGKVLGFLADQDGGEKGVFVDFLGKKASTPAGPAVFAEKFESAIVPGFIFHRPNGGHHIVIGSPFIYEADSDSELALEKNTVRMTKIIEEAIKQHPKDWLWFQKRWNTQYRG